mmetsp:Transcript_1625/g.5298  ORF Transcript_1625/g.5298 Transcript_1625/m.5298 type:complete len:293 (+) Transcript_1625:2302-3180(+)
MQFASHKHGCPDRWGGRKQRPGQLRGRRPAASRGGRGGAGHCSRLIASRAALVWWQVPNGRGRGSRGQVGAHRRRLLRWRGCGGHVTQLGERLTREQADLLDFVGERAQQVGQQARRVCLALRHHGEQPGDRVDGLLAHAAGTVCSNERERGAHLWQHRRLAQQERDDRLGGGGADTRVLMSQSRSERAGKAGDVRLDVTRKRLANLDADGARYLLGIREGVCESGRKRRDELGQIGGERRSGALADVTEELEQLQPQLLRRLGLRRADTARHARQDVCERGQERLHRERLE